MDKIKNSRKTIFKNLKKIYHYPLFILILILLVLVSYLITIQIRIGVPYWDVYNYLNNAIIFAGMGGENINTIMYLSPLLPYLTSLFFRMGYISINVIFILSGVIFVIGVIGLYLLFKERFNPIQSLTASLIFVSLPVVLSWAVSGCTDIPGVSFSIWAIYFMVLGVKKDSKFLYLILPMLVIAFLVRYTAGLIIIPIFLYLLINKNHIKKIGNIRKIILGVIIEFGVLISILAYFFIMLKTATPLFSLFSSIASSSFTGVNDVAYNTNILYYIENLLKYISVGPFQGTYQEILNPSQGTTTILSYAITIITIIGLSFYIQKVLSIKRNFRDNIPIINKVIKIMTISVLLILFISSFYLKSFILSEIILLATLYITYKFLTNETKNYEKHKLDLDFMFLSWFGVYLIFQSTLPLKVDRYFITMAPALVYFIVLGLSEFISKLKPKIKYQNFKSWGIYVIVALLFLSLSTATFIGHTPKKTFTVDIGNSSEWLKEYDPSYKEKIISSDYPNAVNWYLKKEIIAAFPRLYSNSEFANYLQKIGADYYIDATSKSHPEIKGYHILKTFGVVAIYEKNKN